MKPKVSIILPVYNTEKYLRECLNSILEQTYENFEAICVDDGSKDASLAILEEYAKKDKRFKVIVQENRGVGVARNRAMKLASGEFILFVDSDDYIEKTALEKTVKRISQCDADICLFNAEDFDAKTGKKIYHNYLSTRLIKDKKVFNPKEFKDNIFMISSNITWNKLYRRSFLIENELEFMENVRYEDTYFIYAVMVCANRACWIDEKLYHYRKFRSDSQMNSDQDEYESFIEAYDKAIELMNEKGLLTDEEIRRCFYKKAAMILVYLFSNLNNKSSYLRFYAALKSGFEDLGIASELKKSDYNANRFEKMLKGFMQASQAEDFLFYERSLLTRDYLEQAQIMYELGLQKKELINELEEYKHKLKEADKKCAALQARKESADKKYYDLKNSRTVAAALKLRKMLTLNGRINKKKNR